MKKAKLMILMSVLTVFACAALGSGSSSRSENTGTTETESGEQEAEAPVENLEDTPEDQLKDLAIGDSVTIRGVTVTVNSVTETETSYGSPTYEVSVTYYNHSGSLVSITPYDWTTVLHTGSDKAHVGGDVSFHLENISDGEEWTGVVTLWKDDNTEKIKFEYSDLSATWIISDEPQAEETSEIELVAGEIGDYGQELALNAGTDLEDKTIGYFVPAGEYEVTNIGEYTNQVNVYKNEVAVVDGWEEWTDGTVELLDVGETKIITVEDGYFINIDPPAHITIKLVDTSLDSAEATSTETTLTDEEQVKTLVAAAEIILKQYFEDDYNISYDEEEKMVTINVWRDGVAAGAIGVQAGTVSKGDWTAMVDGLQSMSESVYDNFEPYGVNVNVNVLNDTNKDNVLLSFLNGVKVYDAVND